jgi:hypothetical protein
MYQLQSDTLMGVAACVIRTTDGACIPADPANTDYQAFLKYQAEGGKVYGADEEVPTPADEEQS